MKPLSTGSRPIMKGFSNNAHVQALSTKLVSDVLSTSRMAPTGFMKQIAGEQSASMVDARNAEEISPDLIRMTNIIISSTIAPNDLVNSSVNYTCEDSNLPAEIQSKLIDIVKDFFDKDYKINAIHKDVLKRALFTDGSVPMLIIPESSLDALINGEQASLESFRSGTPIEISSAGFLGSSTGDKLFKGNTKLKASMESSGNIKLEPVKKKSSKDGKFQLLEVVDNLDILKLGDYMKRNKSSSIASSYAGSMESLTYVEPSNDKEKEDTEVKLKPSDIAAMFHSRQGTSADGSLTVKTPDQLGRQNKGHPLCMYLPHDSTIPVYMPGNPKEHYGYYVLLENGYPISPGSKNSYINKEMDLKLSSSKQSDMLASLRDELSDSPNSSTKDDIKVSELRDKFKDKVVKGLIERIANGKYGEDVNLPEVHSAYNIMLSRALEQKMTQVLFVPRELMTYVAFDHDENGIGISMHERNKMINLTRSTLAFSNTMANINNAINRKKITINMNPEDAEPDESLTAVLTNLRQQELDAYPLNKTSPFGLYSSLQRSGITTQIQGHPDLQGTEVDVEHVRSDNVVIDTTHYENVKEEQFLAYGVIPELMTSSASSDFAIDSIQRNILFNQSTTVRQETYNGFLTDHVQKYVLNSGTLMGKMIKMVAKHRQEVNVTAIEKMEEVTGEEVENFSSISGMTVMEIIVTFLKALNVKLPALDNNELTSQLEVFRTAKDACSEFTDQMLPDNKMELLYGQDYREKAGAIREVLKTYILRRFLTENNIMKNFLDILGDDETVLGDIKLEIENQAGLNSAINAILEELKKKLDGNSSSEEERSY